MSHCSRCRQTWERTDEFSLLDDHAQFNEYGWWYRSQSIGRHRRECSQISSTCNGWYFQSLSSSESLGVVRTRRNSSLVVRRCKKKINSKNLVVISLSKCSSLFLKQRVLWFEKSPRNTWADSVSATDTNRDTAQANDSFSSSITWNDGWSRRWRGMGNKGYHRRRRRWQVTLSLSRSHVPIIHRSLCL